MIYLFAGHHLADPGARAPDGTTEAQLTIEFRNLILQHLPARMVRIDNDRETLTELLNRMKPGSGSVLLDIHFNSARNPTATGIEAFIADTAGADSRAFAADLVIAGANMIQVRNRGVKTEIDSHRGRLGVLHTAAGISALIELVFLSNSKDMEKWHKSKYELAKVYAQILISWDALRS